MSKLKYLILQVSPEPVGVDREGRLGVLTPVNLDGFYSDAGEAEKVGAFMAQERPDLDTFVVSVVKAVRVNE